MSLACVEGIAVNAEISGRHPHLQARKRCGLATGRCLDCVDEATAVWADETGGLLAVGVLRGADAIDADAVGGLLHPAGAIGALEAHHSAALAVVHLSAAFGVGLAVEHAGVVVEVGALEGGVAAGLRGGRCGRCCEAQPSKQGSSSSSY